MQYIYRAGASGPAGPVLAGPIFRRLRGVSRHTPSFYNIAMRIVDSCARRSGHAVKMPTIAVEQKKEKAKKNEKVACWELQNIDSPLLGTVY